MILFYDNPITSSKIEYYFLCSVIISKMHSLRFTRKHGLQRPFHHYQLISWLISAYNIIIFSVLVLPECSFSPRIPFAISFAILCSCYLLIGFKVSTSDPTDPAVTITRESTDKE
jgi:hypothetical protein